MVEELMQRFGIENYEVLQIIPGKGSRIYDRNSSALSGSGISRYGSANTSLTIPVPVWFIPRLALVWTTS